MPCSVLSVLFSVNVHEQAVYKGLPFGCKVGALQFDPASHMMAAQISEVPSQYLRKLLYTFVDAI